MSIQIDARGLSCPLPVMHTKKAVIEGVADLTVLVDSGTAKQNVVNLLSDAGYETGVVQGDDAWTISAKRA